MEKTKKTKVFIVLGSMLQKDGTVPDDFRARIERAVEQVREGEGWHTVIILSGGQTREEHCSEAEVAHPLLMHCLHERGLENVVTVLLETSSRTTPENIVFSQLLLAQTGIVPDELVIVGRESPGTKDNRDCFEGVEAW